VIKNSVISLFIRTFMGGLFVYAGVVKVWNPGEFFHDVLSYRILPDFLAAGLTWYLPYLEIVCGMMLFFRSFARESATVLLGLLVVFIVALFSAWIRGLDISCGCFGSQNDLGYHWMLLRNITLLGSLLWLQWSMSPKKALFDARFESL